MAACQQSFGGIVALFLQGFIENQLPQGVFQLGKVCTGGDTAGVFAVFHGSRFPVTAGEHRRPRSDGIGGLGGEGIADGIHIPFPKALCQQEDIAFRRQPLNLTVGHRPVEADIGAALQYPQNAFFLFVRVDIHPVSRIQVFQGSGDGSQGAVPAQPEIAEITDPRTSGVNGPEGSAVLGRGQVDGSACQSEEAVVLVPDLVVNVDGAAAVDKDPADQAPIAELVQVVQRGQAPSVRKIVVISDGGQNGDLEFFRGVQGDPGNEEIVGEAQKDALGPKFLQPGIQLRGMPEALPPEQSPEQIIHSVFVAAQGVELSGHRGHRSLLFFQLLIAEGTAQVGAGMEPPLQQLPVGDLPEAAAVALGGNVGVGKDLCQIFPGPAMKIGVKSPGGGGLVVGHRAHDQDSAVHSILLSDGASGRPAPA